MPVTLTPSQQRHLSDLTPGQWYGDRTAPDVLHWPAHWDKKAFRPVLRRLRDMGALETRMRTYEYGYTAFNVRRPLN